MRAVLPFEHLTPGDWRARIPWGPSSLLSQEDRLAEHRRPGDWGVRIPWGPSSLSSQEDRLLST